MFKEKLYFVEISLNNRNNENFFAIPAGKIIESVLEIYKPRFFLLLLPRNASWFFPVALPTDWIYFRQLLAFVAFD